MNRTFTLRELASVLESSDELPADPRDLVQWAAGHRSAAEGELELSIRWDVRRRSIGRLPT